MLKIVSSTYYSSDLHKTLLEEEVQYRNSSNVRLTPHAKPHFFFSKVLENSVAKLILAKAHAAVEAVRVDAGRAVGRPRKFSVE